MRASTRSRSLVAFGLAEATFGNGLVATFVAALALGAAREEVPRAFTRFNDNLSTILQVVTFVLFGALIVATRFESSIVALVVFIMVVLLVARPAAVYVAFRRSKLSRPEQLFIAWFGPKGVASILFALFVLESQAPDRTLVFDILAMTTSRVRRLTRGGRTDPRSQPAQARPRSPPAIRRVTRRPASRARTPAPR
jgi:NhaP-type Na+/H+ and K+/H+ antiporter